MFLPAVAAGKLIFITLSGERAVDTLSISVDERVVTIASTLAPGLSLVGGEAGSIPAAAAVVH